MTNETTVVKTPQEKIAELKIAKAAAFKTLQSITDADSVEATTASLEIYKISQAIKAEEAAIAREASQKEIAEKRNARIALVDNLLAAHAHHLKVSAGKGTAEEKATALDEFTKQYENVKNELLAKYVTVSAPKADGGTSTKGEKGKAIIAAYEANKATGMTTTENIKAIIASGHSRGTTGSVVLAHRKAIGEVE